MKLEINGEEILFELENERNLLDLVNSVTSNLSKSGYIDFKFNIDGQKICLHNDEWKQRLLSDIKCIKVEGDLVYDFSECLSILDLGKKVFNQVEVDLVRIKELLSIWPCFMLSLRFWLVDFHLGENYFSTMSNLSDLFERYIISNSDLREKVLRFLNLSEAAMREKGRELEKPQEEIFSVINRLQEFRGSFINLSLLFQNGNESKALKDILGFMELFYKLLRTLNFLPQNYSDFRERIVQITKNISTKMQNFTKACEVKDYVLAADLAEYEIVPQLKKLDGLKNLLENGV